MAVIEQLGRGVQTPGDTLFSVRGNGRKWAAALASRSTTNPARFIFYGDSLTEGATPTSGIPMLDKVRNRFAVYNGNRRGPGWINAAPDSSLATNGVAQSAVVHPYRFRLTVGTYGGGGANVVQLDKGIAGYAFLLDTSSVLTLSDGANATTTAVFDRGEFHYAKKKAAGSAQLEILIDGAVVQTIETQDSAIGPAYDSGYTYVWTGTRGPHTVDVRCKAGTADAVFEGVYLADGDTVMLYNAGNLGEKFSDVLSGTNIGRFQVAKNIDADGAMFLFGTNDFNDGVTVFSANMLQGITDLRAACADVSLSVACPHPAGSRQTTGDGTASNDVWSTHVAMMKRNAARTDVPVCDLSWMLQTQASTTDPQNMVLGDDIHLETNGAEFWASQISRFLTGADVDWVAQLDTIATRLLSETSYKSNFDGTGTAAVTADAYGTIVGYFIGRHADGTFGAPSQTSSGRVAARLASNVWGDAGARTNNGNPNAALDFITSAAATASSAPTDLRLMLPGAGVTPVERVRFLSLGGQRFSETAALPATATDKLDLLTRDDGTQSQLVAQTPDGVVHQLTATATTIASSATPTPNADRDEMYAVTALAAGATFGAPTGTPRDGQKLLIRVKDNGTARTLAWNAIYRVIGVTLPTTTVISKLLYVQCVYNAADTKWDVLAVGQQT